MKKILISTLVLLALAAIANQDIKLNEDKKIQAEINEIGFKILNANRIEKRVVFAYDDTDKRNILKNNKPLTKRQVVVFSDIYKNIETEDELAAYIAREIPRATRSYDGLGNGFLAAVKLKAAPKKYELVFDKLAVDYMVKAGYNPLGLIIHISKTYPQTRQDKISAHNLTSRRLAYIYERIYFNYPSYLINNEYIDNVYYQNYLLTSRENRKITAQKAKNRFGQWQDYE
ncbi:MAG: hypothetical protein IJD57_01025 [Candidatus Gastranaerophilales bacterium]|nr:hypothetical protein [Candidatus Gastranaerophilales bacterium]